jgi:hypothetical protein
MVIGIAATQDDADQTVSPFTDRRDVAANRGRALGAEELTMFPVLI